MTNDELKIHACDVVRELISQSQEGFHGSMYEMTDAMHEIAPHMFVGDYDGENDHDIDDVVSYSANQRIAAAAFNDVVFGMIMVVTDHVDRVANGASQRLRIGSAHRMGCVYAFSRDVESYIIDEMCACLNIVAPSSVFTREFFEVRR